MSALFLVATPIGNLEDITLRAIRVLKEVDFVLCEDTRVTKRLLGRFGIKKSLLSYHQRSNQKKADEISALLNEGKNLALVCDAGTPGISDPGNELISLALQQPSPPTIIPVPGASALTAAASIAGFPMDKFLFLGFPPAKKGRKKFFEQVATSSYPVIFYESPYRILRSLSELQPNTKVVVGRELTKKFETIYRGSIAEVFKKIQVDSERGEFVVVVGVDRV